MITKTASLTYQKIIRPLLFKVDPEKIHDTTIKTAKLVGKTPIKHILKPILTFKHPSLKQTIFNQTFENPVGLAAGFDKNGQLLNILPCTGLGFMEVGSITALPNPGNAKPRVWRLPKHKALQIYYGLPNVGVRIAEKNLRSTQMRIPLGINIAATPTQENLDVDHAIVDYLTSLDHIHNIPTYVTINVSCPNASSGCMFMDPSNLKRLLEQVSNKYSVPILLKLSPDITDDQLKQIVKLAIQYNIDGFICTNLIKNKEAIEKLGKSPKGGISGKPLQKTTNNIIKKIYKLTNGKKVIIGLGGIFTAKDAYDKIKSGANLIQAITGFIYEGPSLSSQINQGLVELLEKDGYKNISEAVGVDA